jgi:hypothetical protein
MLSPHPEAAANNNGNKPEPTFCFKTALIIHPSSCSPPDQIVLRDFKHTAVRFCRPNQKLAQLLAASFSTGGETSRLRSKPHRPCLNLALSRSVIISSCVGAIVCPEESRLSKSISPASRRSKSGGLGTTLPRLSLSRSSGRIRKNLIGNCLSCTGCQAP